MSTFWDQLALSAGMPRNVAPASPLVEEEHPYTVLAASAGATPSAVVASDAKSLFPVRDSSVAALTMSGTYAVPTGYAKDPTDPSVMADFVDWHSGWQVEYVRTHGVGTPPVLVLGAGAYAYGSTLTAVLASDGTKVLTVDLMSRADLTALGLDDQAAIAGTTAFKDSTSGVGRRFNLAPWGTQTSDAVRTDLLTLCTETSDAFVATGSTLTDEQIGYFKSGVALIKTGIESQAVFDLTQIKTAIEDIQKRYDLAFAFASVAAETAEKTNRIKNVVSLDGGTMLNTASRSIISFEQGIADINAKIRALVEDNAAKTQGKLSVASLVAQVQFLTNARKAYEVKAMSEEINQLRALMETYLTMQTLVNNTSVAIGTNLTATKPAQNITGTTVTSTYAELDERSQKAVNMFDDWSSTALHPLEKSYGWDRPTFNMINDADPAALNSFKKSQWDGFGTVLTDKIQIMSNQVELMTNKLNRVESERNKHGDMANKANARLQEVFLAILAAGDA